MRSRVEPALRAAGFAAIVLWMALGLRPRAKQGQSAPVAELATALPRWTSAEPVGAVHVRLDTAPDATNAAWLAALNGAGVDVTWQGDVPAIAIETYPARDPSRGVFVAVASDTDGELRDELGPVDTARAGLTVIRLPSADGEIAFSSGRQGARASVVDHAAPKRVLVVGEAGWEAKFVIAALEENGWLVDARLALAPGNSVDQGSRAPLDTARYTAIVLLDSAAGERTRGVESFVRAGGGVVLSGDASRAGAVAELLAWTGRKHEAAPLGTAPADTTWRGLSRVALTPVADRRAIALERRSGDYAVVARRHYAGRVAAVGYDQTWRWRMGGAGNSLAEHRDWWSRVVASVAPTVIPNEVRDLQSGSAPLASIHATLGPPASPRTAIASWWTSPILANLLGALAFSALVSEWLLRRSRGER